MLPVFACDVFDESWNSTSSHSLFRGSKPAQAEGELGPLAGPAEPLRFPLVQAGFSREEVAKSLGPELQAGRGEGAVAQLSLNCLKSFDDLNISVEFKIIWPTQIWKMSYSIVNLSVE